MSDPLQPLAVALAAQLRAELGRIAEELAELRSQIGSRPPLLDRDGCAKMLGICLRTLDGLRAEGLPELRVGDSPRFDADAVMHWLRARSSVKLSTAVNHGQSANDASQAAETSRRAVGLAAGKR